MRKTVVGTNVNSSVGGPATTTKMDTTNKPSNTIVNNVNLSVTDGKTKSCEILPTTTTQEENPYSDIKVEYKERELSDVFVNGEPYKEQVQQIDSTIQHEHDVLTFLNEAFKGIITSDRKSFVNIVDQSGFIVLPITDLIILIAKVCQIDSSKVKIELEDEVDTGCCGIISSKYVPLKQIRNIKIIKETDNYTDFQLTHNDLYNKIIEVYGISLERVYEPVL